MPSSPPAQVKDVTTVDRDSSGASVPKGSFPEELAYKNQPPCSYQQISCLDSVVRYTGHLRPSPPLLSSPPTPSHPHGAFQPSSRYLESCNEAATLKRKCEFPANIPSRKATVSPGLHSGGILSIMGYLTWDPLNLLCGVRSRHKPSRVPLFLLN